MAARLDQPMPAPAVGRCREREMGPGAAARRDRARTPRGQRIPTSAGRSRPWPRGLDIHYPSGRHPDHAEAIGVGATLCSSETGHRSTPGYRGQRPSSMFHVKRTRGLIRGEGPAAPGFRTCTRPTRWSASPGPRWPDRGPPTPSSGGPGSGLGPGDPVDVRQPPLGRMANPSGCAGGRGSTSCRPGSADTTPRAAGPSDPGRRPPPLDAGTIRCLVGSGSTLPTTGDDGGPAPGPDLPHPSTPWARPSTSRCRCFT